MRLCGCLVFKEVGVYYLGTHDHILQKKRVVRFTAMEGVASQECYPKSVFLRVPY